MITFDSAAPELPSRDLLVQPPAGHVLGRCRQASGDNAQRPAIERAAGDAGAKSDVVARDR